MKAKKFDCVQMKHDIQQRIAKEFEGLSDEEQWAITEKRILANPILGPVWKKAKPVFPRGFEPDDETTDNDEDKKRDCP
jgi:hypothetical protein